MFTEGSSLAQPTRKMNDTRVLAEANGMGVA